MKAKHHFWSSAALGGVLYFATDAVSAILGALLGGFLIDADHIVDQVWSIRDGAPRPSRQEATQSGWKGWFSYYFRRRKLTRLPLVFHSLELLLLLALATYLIRTPFAIGFFSGYVLHIGLDFWRHQHEFLSPFFYCFAYRFRRRFRRELMIKAEYR